MSTDLFEIVEQNTYSITIQKIDNIEDCGDEFITKEELEELGVDHCWSGTRLFNNKIKNKIQEYLSQIPKDKKSIKIDDNELIEVLKDSYNPISYFVPNTRRVGDRLYKHNTKDKTQTKVLFKDWKSLMMLFIKTLWWKYEVEIDIKLSNKKRQECVIQFKKMIDWESIIEYNNSREHYSLNEDKLIWVKKLYDDPTLIKDKG